RHRPPRHRVRGAGRGDGTAGGRRPPRGQGAAVRGAARRRPGRPLLPGRARRVRRRPVPPPGARTDVVRRRRPGRPPGRAHRGAAPRRRTVAGPLPPPAALRTAPAPRQHDGVARRVGRRPGRRRASAHRPPRGGDLHVGGTTAGPAPGGRRRARRGDRGRAAARPRRAALARTGGRMTKLLVLNVVALTPQLLEHMPRLRRVAQQGYQAALDTVLPAVTCTAQSTYLTGLPPSEHGIVANGWFFRDLGDVLLWRQHSGLVEGERVWETIRRHRPGYRVANVCWWYAMGADVDTTVTPRPEYHADGRKEPDCWTWPPSLHDELVAELGPFPLFTFWGP